MESTAEQHHPSGDEMRARLARLDAMIQRANSLPSWPTIAAQLEQLLQAVETLTARVDELEQRCQALVQRELIRLWEMEE